MAERIAMVLVPMFASFFFAFRAPIAFRHQALSLHFAAWAIVIAIALGGHNA